MRDLEGLLRIGHTLKGVSPSYGFVYLGSLGAQLEIAAGERNLAFCESLISEMKTHIENVQISYSSVP